MTPRQLAPEHRGHQPDEADGPGDGNASAYCNGRQCNDFHCQPPWAEAERGGNIVAKGDYEFDEVALAFGNGIDGYIVKEISCEPLIESLKLVALGEKVLPSQLARTLSDFHPRFESGNQHDTASAACLSEREAEILRCLTVGMANKVMSRLLNISEATVKVHVKAILRKLRLSNRTQAAIWAIKHGFEQQPVESVDTDPQPNCQEAEEASLVGYAD